MSETESTTTTTTTTTDSVAPITTTTTPRYKRVPVKFDQVNDAAAADTQSQSPPSTRPNSGIIPSSPILNTTPGLSPRISSSVRFSSSASFPNSESLPSLVARSDSSNSGPTSPTSGPSRPRMPARQSSVNRSRPGSVYTSATQYKRPTSSGSTLIQRRAWPSTKLKGEIEKPWVKYPDPAHRWGKIIFWSLVGLGFAAGAACTSSLA
jgi:hypothetical protein